MNNLLMNKFVYISVIEFPLNKADGSPNDKYIFFSVFHYRVDSTHLIGRWHVIE